MVVVFTGAHTPVNRGLGLPDQAPLDLPYDRTFWNQDYRESSTPFVVLTYIWLEYGWKSLVRIRLVCVGLWDLNSEPYSFKVGAQKPCVLPLICYSSIIC